MHKCLSALPMPLVRAAERWGRRQGVWEELTGRTNVGPAPGGRQLQCAGVGCVQGAQCTTAERLRTRSAPPVSPPLCRRHSAAAQEHLGRSPPSPARSLQLALWWALLEGCSESIRSGDAFSALLYLLTHSNTTVGVVQGCNGLAQMAAALPAGWLADRHRRDTLLRAGAGVGAAAGAVLAAALVLRPDAVWALAAASILLGCYRGVYSAALEALFADSIEPGRRWAGRAVL